MQPLYSQLLKLTQDSEAFYFTDHVLDTTTYRIFLYRLASYTDFCLPGALECRGTMFEMDGEDPVRLAARPMQKFFNINECPFTMGVNYSDGNIESVMLKEDGSLISTFIHTDGELYCKSKGSLSSDQAQWANAWIRKESMRYDQLKTVTNLGNTINLEYCAPFNRIVLNYNCESMIILNVRQISSGLYLPKSTFKDTCPYIPTIWVNNIEDTDIEYDTLESLIDDTPNLENIEGFVVRLKNGLHFKVKTNWYLVQHRAKDSIDSPRRLFEAAITEATDDLRSLFTDNQFVLDKITEMEEKAAGIYNHIVERVERFVKTHHDLIENDCRKDFAMLGQQAFLGTDKRLFGLVMMCYKRERGDGDGPDYKQFCIKNWRDWGLKDGPEDDE